MEQGTTTVIRKTFSSKLSEEVLQTMRRVAERHTYPPKAILCHQGEIEHTFYIIVSGRVLAARIREDGAEQMLGVLGPNDYFGEMALIDNRPRMATCTTLTETTVLEITETVFDQLVEQSPTVAYAITQRVIATMRQLDDDAIGELKAKNEALSTAYAELQAAQAQVVEKERLERELELAATVQRSLLPSSLPSLPDVAFVAHLEPARQVGGDLYDVMVLDDEHVGLLIADVADKGFHAALFMAVTRTLFHTEAKRSLSPAEVALAVHQNLLSVASDSDVFVTALYGVLHRPSGRLRYVRAGQERPFLLRPSHPPTMLTGDGRFLGMLPELSLPEYSCHLQKGDKLVMYSGGIPDSIDLQGNDYGNGRFEALSSTNAHLTASQLANTIVTHIDHWTQNAAPFDDLTLLIMEAN